MPTKTTPFFLPWSCIPEPSCKHVALYNYLALRLPDLGFGAVSASSFSPLSSSSSLSSSS